MQSATGVLAAWLLALAGCNSVLGNPAPGPGSGGESGVGSGGVASGGAPASGGTGSGGTFPGSGGGSPSGGASSTGGTSGVECVPACGVDQGCSNGSCQPILPECMGKSVGMAVCSEDSRTAFVCGEGLVVRSEEETCDHFCSQGACVEPPSCIGLPTTCGDSESGSCCESLLVTGGDFARGSADDFPATISDFRFDKYEVTVGRFRKFVAAMVAGFLPEPGSGKHAHLRGGSGLLGTTGEDEAGWNTDWNVGGTTYRLFSGPGTEDDWSASLQCSGDDYHTWTPTADLNETLPINCVNWYQAAAFCIWDGGFLPSEAEWEYAASGGAAERDYPWGSADPDATRSAHYCLFEGGVQDECVFGDIAPVGALPGGDGLFGQSDLGGNMWEWTQDWFASPYPIVQCVDCTSTMPGEEQARSGRGGSWMSDEPSQGSIYRAYRTPDSASEFYGLRCARMP